MAKFHINPQKGPLACNAQPGNCKYGYTEQEHFTNFDEAQKYYEETLAKQEETLKSYTKADMNTDGISHVLRTDESLKYFTPELMKLNNHLDKVNYDKIMEYAAASPHKHDEIDQLINARAYKAMADFNKIDKLNPFSENCSTPISYGNYKKLKTELDQYRDNTAIIVEAYQESPYYSSPVADISPETIGTTNKVASYEHNDVRWHTSRFNTVGGSDVGTLAKIDFTDPTKLKSWDRKSLDSLEESKIHMISESDAKKSIATSETSRKGALYRGTMWEDRIRDQYALDHPELTVYKVKDQYAMENNEMVRANFDGLISDRADGAPNGILEIKTGGDPAAWSDGIPLNYRAQTLYYLHATGFKYADLRVNINDGDFQEYRLYASDEVAPGCGVNMAEYVQNRIIPWMNNLKAQRRDEALVATA